MLYNSLVPFSYRLYGYIIALCLPPFPFWSCFLPLPYCFRLLAFCAAFACMGFWCFRGCRLCVLFAPLCLRGVLTFYSRARRVRSRLQRYEKSPFFHQLDSLGNAFRLHSRRPGIAAPPAFMPSRRWHIFILWRHSAKTRETAAARSHSRTRAA